MKLLWDQPALSYSTHGSQKSGVDQKHRKIFTQPFMQYPFYTLRRHFIERKWLKLKQIYLFSVNSVMAPNFRRLLF